MAKISNTEKYDKINFKLHTRDGVLTISLHMIKLEKTNSGQLVEHVVDYYVAKNPKNVKAILDTLVETADSFKFNNGQLISNYRKNDSFVIDNYDVLKGYPQLREFSKKVDRALEKERIKSSSRNIRISKNKRKLKNIKKILGLGAATLGELGACFAAWEYGSYFVDLSNSKHEMLAEDEYDVIQETDNNVNLYSSNIGVQSMVPKILMKEKQYVEPDVVNDVVSEIVNNDAISSQKLVVEQTNDGVIVPEVSKNEEDMVVKETTNNIQDIVQESQSYYEQVLREAKDNLQAFLQYTKNIEVNNATVASETVSENVESESSNEGFVATASIENPIFEEDAAISSDMNEIIDVVDPMLESVPVVTKSDESLEEECVEVLEGQAKVLEVPEGAEIATNEVETAFKITGDKQENVFPEEKVDSSEVASIEENIGSSAENIVSDSIDSAVYTKDNVTSLSVLETMSLEFLEEVTTEINKVHDLDDNSKEVQPVEDNLVNLVSSSVEITPTVVGDNQPEISEYGLFLATTTDTVFRSKPYYNVTEQEKLKIAAVVAGEDSYTYEGSLAVMSTVLNRCDTKEFSHYGGENPYKQVFHQSQFVAKDGSIAKKYYNHPEEIPDFVIAAVEDALNGYRNHSYTSFRAKKSEGRVRIGEKGNWYFQKSDSVPNYGLVEINEKVR